MSRFKNSNKQYYSIDYLFYGIWMLNEGCIIVLHSKFINDSLSLNNCYYLIQFYSYMSIKNKVNISFVHISLVSFIFPFGAIILQTSFEFSNFK